MFDCVRFGAGDSIDVSFVVPEALEGNAGLLMGGGPKKLVESPRLG